MTYSETERAKYQRQWRLKNPKKQKGYDKKYYEKHREEILLKRRKEYVRMDKTRYKRYYWENRKRILRKTAERHRKLKEKYIKMLDSKCSKCGINAMKSNLCIFDFHHTNPEEKESNREQFSNDFTQKILDGKIKLLCANCHRLEHLKYVG